MAERPLEQGVNEAFLAVAGSQVATFVLTVIGLIATLLAFVVEPVAGAIVAASLIVGFACIGVYALVLRDRFGGLYETISDESEWEILDTHGEMAVLHKTQKFRFLQNGVCSIRDYAWGDGDVMDDYECIPGEWVDRYEVAGKHYILISLRETKKRGDTETFEITRQVKSMFTGDSEWIAMQITQPTRVAKLAVTFPLGRPPTGVWLKGPEDLDHRQRQLPREGLPDNRQRVSITIPKPELQKTYTIWWEW